jgi:penicillin-insensitive murein endopeptidase
MLGRAPALAALAAIALAGCAPTWAGAPGPATPAAPGAPAAPGVDPAAAPSAAPAGAASSAPSAPKPALALVGSATRPPPEGTPVDENGDAVDDDHDDLDDDDDGGIAAPPRSPLVGQRPPSLTMDDAAFARAMKDDRASLGSMSIGRPNQGILVNGVRMPEGRAWSMNQPELAYGTKESVDALVRAITRVDSEFPGTPPLPIGHISAKNGGPLTPHKSHQAGRDADIGYYYTGRSPWFARATAQNLDRARTWELVKAFADSGEVEMLLIDTSIQVLLRDYALAHHEDAAYVDRVFQVGSHNPRPLVRHVHGHATHIHVRFVSAVAREVGARAEPFYRADLDRIAARQAAKPAAAGKHGKVAGKETPGTTVDGKPLKPGQYVEHKVHDGDTLYRLAKHYNVSVEAIQKANGLKGFALKPRMVLRIPKG